MFLFSFVRNFIAVVAVHMIRIKTLNDPRLRPTADRQGQTERQGIQTLTFYY